MMIALKNVSKIFNYKKNNELYALENINLEIEEGEFCAIIGKSGSGKSTLLHILGLLDSFSDGYYYFDKKDVSKMSDHTSSNIRARNMGFVKQDFALIEDYTAIENVVIPLYPLKEKNKYQKAKRILERLGIEKLSNKEIRSLSGGEKQRVAIARAIINRPRIIFADEPTGSLDSKTASEIMEIFKSLNNEGRTVIIVTHDMGVAQICNRVIEISDGRIISDN